MNSVFLLTGGNIGNRIKNLESAATKIEKEVGKILQSSSVYETAAWGVTDQQAFLNQVLEVETTLTPQDLLSVILSIEKQLGRERLQRFGPRTIDIDILFYNDEIISTETLSVPHPEMQNRRFVLVPLNEIAETIIHPILNKPVNQLLQECKDELEVSIYSVPNRS